MSPRCLPGTHFQYGAKPASPGPLTATAPAPALPAPQRTAPARPCIPLTMPVTVVRENHEPRPRWIAGNSRSLDEFLRQSGVSEYSNRPQVRASSFYGDGPFQEDPYPSSPSLIRSAVQAWGCHSHLRIRPDDIWLQILIQQNFFARLNGEHLQGFFHFAKGEHDIESH